MTTQAQVSVEVPASSWMQVNKFIQDRMNTKNFFGELTIVIYDSKPQRLYEKRSFILKGGDLTPTA